MAERVDEAGIGQRAVNGRRPRVDDAAPTEEGVIREMARCLALIKEGKVPK
ncbi:MAG: hypothetical protein M3N29_08965 [Chloroflexota bacterium]|nr:hypothetical protein [Chloroflexota bacterium]